MRELPSPVLHDRVPLTCVRETHREVHSRLWQPEKRQEHHHVEGPAPEHPDDAHRHPGVQPASPRHQNGHDTILSPSYFIPSPITVGYKTSFFFVSASKGSRIGRHIVQDGLSRHIALKPL